MKAIIQDSIQRSIAVKTAILNDDAVLSQIALVAEKMIALYKAGKKTLFAGNGGSAADAQHLAAELVNRFTFDHDGLPSIALTTDSSVLTSIANDYGYDVLFLRQVVALGVEGDMFIGISTSGNSGNIIKAIQYCKEHGIYTVGLTGTSGGLMKALCDTCICVPSDETARIQEAHILIGHILCGLVESALFAKK